MESENSSTKSRAPSIDEFTGMIAATEAAMRNKLSELTMLGDAFSPSGQAEPSPGLETEVRQKVDTENRTNSQANTNLPAKGTSGLSIVDTAPGTSKPVHKPSVVPSETSFNQSLTDATNSETSPKTVSDASVSFMSLTDNQQAEKQSSEQELGEKQSISPVVVKTLQVDNVTEKEDMQDANKARNNMSSNGSEQFSGLSGSSIKEVSTETIGGENHSKSENSIVERQTVPSTSTTPQPSDIASVNQSYSSSDATKSTNALEEQGLNVNLSVTNSSETLSKKTDGNNATDVTVPDETESCNEAQGHLSNKVPGVPVDPSASSSSDPNMKTSTNNVVTVASQDAHESAPFTANVIDDLDDEADSPALIIDENQGTSPGGEHVTSNEPMETDANENRDSNQSEERTDGLVISNVISLSGLVGNENASHENEPISGVGSEPVPTDKASRNQDNSGIMDNDSGSDLQSDQINGTSVVSNKLETSSRRKRKQTMPSVRKVTDDADIIDDNGGDNNASNTGPQEEGNLDNLTFLVHHPKRKRLSQDSGGNQEKIPNSSSESSDGQNAATSMSMTDVVVKSEPQEVPDSSANQLPVIGSTFSMNGITNLQIQGSHVIPLNNAAPVSLLSNLSAEMLLKNNPNTPSLYTGKKVVAAVSSAQKIVMKKVKSVPTNLTSVQTKVVGSVLPQGLQSFIPIAMKPSVSSASSSEAGNVVKLLGKQADTKKNGRTAGNQAETSKSGNFQFGKVVEVSKQTNATNKARNMNSINIQSVGVARITGLIARKNPIPTYKPATKDLIDGKSYPCYECGDTFGLQKSLDIHMGRRSMKLQYKCERCRKFIEFTNKCQLLNHLRSHMNIAKTQAVPIHIKSDSINIRSYYDDIQPGVKFDWYKVTVVEQTCPMCHVFHYRSLDERQSHYNNLNGNLRCDECNKSHITTACGLKAHKMLHRLVEMNKERGEGTWLEEDLEILKGMVCPECGFQCPKPPDHVPTPAWWLIEQFLSHVMQQCFHMSRIEKEVVTCNKCSIAADSSLIEKHLYAEMENYYKCERCPMALKSLHNLQTHFIHKHKDEESIQAKIIYRCHVCSTLIDDSEFLVLHMKRHVASFKHCKTETYYCFTCGLVLNSAQAMKMHSQVHYRQHLKGNKTMMSGMCPLCRKKFANCLEVLGHMFDAHLKQQQIDTQVFCKDCGLLCVDASVERKHPCLGKLNQIKVLGDTGNQNQIVYRCTKCSMKLTNARNLMVHMKTHEQASFICFWCGETKECNRNEFKSHMIYCEALMKQKQKNPTAALQTMLSKQAAAPVSYSSGRKTEKVSESSDDKKDSRTATEEIADESESEISLTPMSEKRTKTQKDALLLHFSCTKCPAVFLRKAKLDAHMFAEHCLHPCHLCGMMHNSEISLKRHLAVEHEGKRPHYYCLICRKKNVEKSFTQQFKLEKHLRKRHRIKHLEESCYVAELPGFKGMAERDISPEDQRPSLSPQACSPEQPPVKKLRVEGEKVFKCAKCLFTCEDKTKFMEHIAEHKTVDAFQCFECGLCFSVLPSLSKHLFMVHKIRDFDKYMNDNKIENPADKVDSEDEIERESEKPKWSDDSDTEAESSINPLECKVCYKQFDSEKQMQGHMRVHGMAFIKKSRRRSQGVSPNDKKDIKSGTRTCEMVNPGMNLLKLKIKVEKLPDNYDSKIVQAENNTETNRGDATGSAQS